MLSATKHSTSMELRNAADALLRCQTNPLTSLLNPAVWRSARRSQLCYRAAGNRNIQRPFSNSSSHSALRPDVTTSAKPEANASESIDELSKNLWTRSSRSSSSPLSLEDEKRMNRGSSANDILAQLSLSPTSKPSTPSSAFDMSRIEFPTSNINDSRSLVGGLSRGHLAMPETRKVPMRLEPSTGRTVTIGSGIDVARGLRLLEQSCARNGVRREATLQRFYERAGLKKKRLRRVRWRTAFMQGFRATVGRVRELKNQGW